MKIEFTPRAILKVIPAVAEQTISTASLTITKIEDLQKDKKVIAYTDHPYAKTITLWEGEAYTSIGQWTDADVVKRIKEIYKK